MLDDPSPLSNSASAANSGSQPPVSGGSVVNVRQRRRWPWLILFFFVVLIILILALPSLLCTGPGIRAIQQQINSRIRGHITIGSLSLGWFTPTALNDVSLRDSHGAIIARNLRVKTQLSLLQTISDWHHFGTLNISIDQLLLVNQATGLNLMRALAAKSPTSSNVASPTSSPTNTKSSTLPPLSGRINLSIASLDWTSPTSPSVRAKSTAFTLMIDTSGKPLDFTFSSQVSTPAHPAASIAMSGKLNLFSQNQLIAPDKITGDISADIKSLDLQSLDPLLASIGVKLKINGSLNGRFAVELPQPGHGRADVDLTFDSLKLSGGMLKGDTPDLGTVHIPVKAAWNGQTFVISKTQITCPMTTIKVTGSGSIASILGLVNHSSTNAQKAELNLRARSDIADLTKQFPHLLGVPAATKFTNGSANVDIQLTAGGAASLTQPAAHSNLPPLKGQILFAANAVSWKSSLYPLARTANADGRIIFDTKGPPLQITMHLSILHGAKTPSAINLTGKLSVFHQQSLLPLTSITGSGNLDIRDFYLDDLNPILGRFHAPLQTHGLLSANLALAAPQAGNGTLKGRLAVSNCSFQGSFINQDNPELGTVALPIAVSWHNQDIVIKNLEMLSKALHLQLHGDASLDALKAIAANKPTWGNARLALTATADLHLLAAAFPHTMKLDQEHAKIHAGTLQILATLNSGIQSASATSKVTISNITGRLKQHNFSVNPALITIAAARNSTGAWQLSSAHIAEASAPTADPTMLPILSADIQSNPKKQSAYSLKLTGDLLPLTGQIEQFGGATGYSDAGQLTLSLDISGVGSPMVLCHLKTQIKNGSFILVAGKPAYTDPDIRIATHVRISLTDGKLSALRCTLFNLHTQFADIGPATALIRQNAAGLMTIPAFDLPLQRISLTKINALLSTLGVNAGPYRVDGNILDSSIIGAATGNDITLSSLHLMLQNLVLSARQPNPPAIFKEAALTLDLAGSMNMSGAQQINLMTLALGTQDHAITVTSTKPLIFAQLPTGKIRLSCQGLTAKADLHLLTALLIVLKKLPSTDQMNGLVTLNAQASTQGPAFNVNTIASIEKYQLIDGTSAVKLPPTNVTCTLIGKGNLTQHEFTCVDNCGVSEQAPDGNGSDSILINKGSTISWAAGGTESITGAANYDLARLQTLLGPWLPAGLVMQGKHDMPLVISGEYANGTGLRQLRKLVISPTAFGFDKISIDGADLGPGQIGFQAARGVIQFIPSGIPANKGTLNLAGKIDLNRKHPAFILSQPLQLAENIQFNAAMGSSILKFLPVAWGTSFKPVGGVAKVTGLLNLQLKNADLPLAYARLKQVGTLSGTLSATHISSNSPLYTLIANLDPQHFLSMSSGQTHLSNSGIRPTNFNLKQGKVYYQNMRVVLVSMGVEFSGWVALDNTLDVDVSMTGARVSIPIPLKITGTTAKPQVKLSGKPLKDIGKNIGNSLKNAGGLFKNLFH